MKKISIILYFVFLLLGCNKANNKELYLLFDINSKRTYYNDERTRKMYSKHGSNGEIDFWIHGQSFGFDLKYPLKNHKKEYKDSISIKKLKISSPEYMLKTIYRVNFKQINIVEKVSNNKYIIYYDCIYPYSEE